MSTDKKIVITKAYLDTEKPPELDPGSGWDLIFGGNYKVIASEHAKPGMIYAYDKLKEMAANHTIKVILPTAPPPAQYYPTHFSHKGYVCAGIGSCAICDAVIADKIVQVDAAIHIPMSEQLVDGDVYYVLERFHIGAAYNLLRCGKFVMPQQNQDFRRLSDNDAETAKAYFGDHFCPGCLSDTDI